MIKKLALFVFVLLIQIGNSQAYKNYDWSADPKLHEMTKEEESASSVGIFEKYMVEYLENQNSVSVFETKHTLAHVFDDKGIAQHNTVYIPMYDIKEVIDIKARTISPSGKLTMLNKDNIKEVENVEEYGDFKIFAIEGAEKGSEIEVLYTLERNFDMHGNERLQYDYPIREASFTFIFGDLNHRLKAYRTKEEFNLTTVNNRAAKSLVITNVPAMIEEEYATPQANNISVSYQCYPAGQNITNEMFWNNVVGNIGSSFYPSEVPAIVTKDIKNITENKEADTPFKSIILLDEYIKSNFNVVQNNNPELSNIDYIVLNRTASEYGILKAYAYYLTALNVDFEIVLTANRFTQKFDPTFFSPNMLQEFLIYVPSEKKYLAPDRPEYRFGEAPYNILGNQAVFLDKNLEYYFSEVVQEEEDFSRIKRTTNITFDDDMESVQINLDQEYYGHWSATNRAVMNWYFGEDLENFKDYLTGSGIEDKAVKDYSIGNEEIMQLEYNKPFTVSSAIESEALLEEAGDFYVFQVGKVIGTQSELYQETERVNPIEMQYPNKYNYTITVNIPDGYEAEGLESLRLNKSYVGNRGNKVAKFESDYSLDDNKIIITIEEFYNQNVYDLNRYEEFRSVINAASDFNKASILIKEVE